MTKKVFNMQGGLHSAAAFTAFENAAWGSCVANAGSFTVSAGTGMNVQIAAGDGIISTQNSGKRIQTDAVETAAVAAASPSYSRIDSVVAYIDNAVVPTTSVVDNTNGVLKFASVAGTAAATPLAPSAASIQAAIGAGNAYMVLYNVTVPSNATNLTAATFTDMRKVLYPITNQTVNFINSGMLGDLAVTTPKIANQSVTTEKLNITSSAGTSGTGASSTSDTYGDGSLALSTTVNVGPSGKILVSIVSLIYVVTGDADAFMSIALSGANTLAATDGRSISNRQTNGVGTGATFLLTGLTAGITTVAVKHRVNIAGKSGNFLNRNLSVVAI